MTQISGDSNDHMFGWNILICRLFFWRKSSLFFLSLETKKYFFYKLSHITPHVLHTRMPFLHNVLSSNEKFVSKCLSTCTHMLKLIISLKIVLFNVKALSEISLFNRKEVFLKQCLEWYYPFEHVGRITLACKFFINAQNIMFETHSVV